MSNNVGESLDSALEITLCSTGYLVKSVLVGERYYSVTYDVTQDAMIVANTNQALSYFWNARDRYWDCRKKAAPCAIPWLGISPGHALFPVIQQLKERAEQQVRPTVRNP